MDNLKWLIIGGSGRSGTSFLSSALLNHPQVYGFRDVELKILGDIDGFLDLYISLVENYSPDRARIALKRFLDKLSKVSSGGFFKGQLSLEKDYKVSMIKTIDSFKSEMTQNGQATRQSKNQFFLKSRKLLHHIYEAGSNTSSLKNPKYFLEKTPHNLLQIKFLSQLLTDAIYIHVMRDPRSIAMSLSKMDWKPGTLITCAEWVNQYLIAWKDISDWARESNINLVEIYIEDIATEPVQSSIEITRTLDLVIDENLFKHVRIGSLNNWSLHVEKKDIDLLNSILVDWVTYHGYSLKHIGIREN